MTPAKDKSRRYGFRSGSSPDRGIPLLERCRSRRMIESLQNMVGKKMAYSAPQDGTIAHVDRAWVSIEGRGMWRTTSFPDGFGRLTKPLVFAGAGLPGGEGGVILALAPVAESVTETKPLYEAVGDYNVVASYVGFDRKRGMATILKELGLLVGSTAA